MTIKQKSVQESIEKTNEVKHLFKNASTALLDFQAQMEAEVLKIRQFKEDAKAQLQKDTENEKVSTADDVLYGLLLLMAHCYINNIVCISCLHCMFCFAEKVRKGVAEASFGSRGVGD